jgi:hypothetical protein
MPAFGKIFLAVQLSTRGRRVLRYAAGLHRRCGAIVDVFYVWSGDGDSRRELETFACAPGAFHALDELTALSDQGLLRVLGWLLPRAGVGRTVPEIAGEDSYALVIDATSFAPRSRFLVVRHDETPSVTGLSPR